MSEEASLALLQSGLDNEARGDAAEALGASVTTESFTALVVAIAERSPLVALGAERALVRRREAGASDALARALERSDADVASRLARVLATRTDAAANEWTRSAIERGHHLEAIRSGLGDRADARAPLHLAAMFAAWEETREDVIYVLKRARVLVAPDLFLEALERCFWTGTGPVPARTLDYAAAVLVARSDALARAQRLLADSDDAFGRQRAICLLEALEVSWGALAEARGAGVGVASDGPDAAWRSLVGPLAALPVTVEDRRALAAATLLRALDWFEGREPFPLALPVSLPQCEAPGDPPYPFLVLGFEVTDRGARSSDVEDLDLLRLPSLAGPRPLFFLHQYGATSCLPARLLGYPLHLSPHDPTALGRLMDAWCGKEGPMSELDAREWDAAIAAGKLHFETGAEGLLVSSPLRDLSTFFGLPTLEFPTSRWPWRAIGAIECDGFATWQAARFGAEHLVVLVALGAHLDEPRARAFFVWSSSD